jgi:hypothetical protein
MIALSPSTSLEQIMMPALFCHRTVAARPAHNLSAKGDRRSGVKRSSVEVRRRQFAHVRNSPMSELGSTQSFGHIG